MGVSWANKQEARIVLAPASSPPILKEGFRGTVLASHPWRKKWWIGWFFLGGEVADTTEHYLGMYVGIHLRRHTSVSLFPPRLKPAPTAEADPLADFCCRGPACIIIVPVATHKKKRWDPIIANESNCDSPPFLQIWLNIYYIVFCQVCQRDFECKRIMLLGAKLWMFWACYSRFAGQHHLPQREGRCCPR